MKKSLTSPFTKKKNLHTVEYLWLDGSKPIQKLRSKTRLIYDNTLRANIPEWSFDGSSTYQSPSQNSDLMLQPIRNCQDPLRGEHSRITLCEVHLPGGVPHKTNHRAHLKKLLNKHSIKNQDIWLSFEQEYTLFKDTRPLGWPKKADPKPQGPYYCGVGTNRVFGRNIVEEHMHICKEAGLLISGINAEVMPGQWEFQIGYRDYPKEIADPLTVSDHLWMARWFLYRIAEKYGIRVSLKSKPMEGDWNGAGLHTNFSSKPMRTIPGSSSSPLSSQKNNTKSYKFNKAFLNTKKRVFKNELLGIDAIMDAVSRLSKKHKSHIAVYGEDLHKRLTGKHETSPIDKFSHGISHRGASVRIPAHVFKNKCGYFEDRRPAANANPYIVAHKLISSLYE